MILVERITQNAFLSVNLVERITKNAILSVNLAECITKNAILSVNLVEPSRILVQRCLQALHSVFLNG